MGDESAEERKEPQPQIKETRMDRVAKLSSILVEKKREFEVISNEIFQLNQDFNNRNEDSKHIKSLIARNLASYVQNTTEAALNESELMYKKDVFDRNNSLEVELTCEQNKEVKEARDELERILSIYRDCRRNILSFQENVTKVTDQSRMDALNSVTFLRYAQSAVVNEIHKISESSYFPTKKESHTLRDECIRHVEKSSRSVMKLYIDKLKEYRRQERILTGRRLEINEQLTLKDAKHDTSRTHVIDSAQFTRTTSPSPRSPVHSPGGAGAHISPNPLDAEYSVIFPDIHSPDPTYRSYHPPPPSHSAGMSNADGGRSGSRGHSGRKESVSEAAFHLPLHTATRQHHATEGSPRLLRRSSKRAGSAGSTTSARKTRASNLFDPAHYAQRDHIQTGTLLADESTHNKQELQDSDEQLSGLALRLAEVEGKQKQLLAVREGLDVQLMKQAHLALSLARDLHADLGVPLPHAVREHLNRAAFTHTSGPVQKLTSETGRTLRDIYFDHRRRLPVEGAIAGVFRYTFDPTVTVSETLRDVQSHLQLLDGLDHQTRILLKIDA